MEIHVRDNKLHRTLDDEAARRRHYGADMANKLRLRLAALRAANALADFWPPKSGPERCHELLGDHAGIFTVDLKQPYRLLFRPRTITVKPDGLDEQEWWKSITEIEILGIEDTHG